MGIRKLVIACATLACAASLAFCGSGTPATEVDAGHKGSPDHAAAVDCYSSDDCAQGDCIQGACVRCTANSCAAGSTCRSTDFKCAGADAGTSQAGQDAASVAPGEDASTGGCTHRQDCPAGEVCHLALCSAPNPTGQCQTDDDCLIGQVCSASSGNTCVTMCFSNLDCSSQASDAGVKLVHCDTSTNHCGPCVSDNDCPGGHCTAGACVQASCTDRSTCGTGACINGQCGPCTTATQCAASGYDCNAGKCVVHTAKCTADAQCTTISPGEWCNTSIGQCQPGCSAAASCGTDCCPAGQQCNTTTHSCENVCADCCNCACSGTQTCDPGSCQCVDNTDNPDGGTITPGMCDNNCNGCAADEECSCLGLLPCIPGLGCFSLGICLPTCTDNSQCTDTPGSYCDLSSSPGMCAEGCAPGSGAACDPDCCTGSKPTCNSTTHACE